MKNTNGLGLLANAFDLPFLEIRSYVEWYHDWRILRISLQIFLYAVHAQKHIKTVYITAKIVQVDRYVYIQ